MLNFIIDTKSNELVLQYQTSKRAPLLHIIDGYS